MRFHTIIEKNKRMKKIFYFIISVVICFTLTSAIQKSEQNSKTVILQATGMDITPASLIRSADIISARLKVYGLKSFDVNPLADKSQIIIHLPDIIQLSEVEGLLISKGELAFYETLERNDFSELLKTNKAGKPLLAMSDVESVNSSVNEATQTILTGIKFKPSAIAVWAEATRRNLNKHIAIVIDNQVFYSPVVRSVIEGGMCEISGNFTQKDTNYFVALVSNGTLPVTLRVIK